MMETLSLFCLLLSKDPSSEHRHSKSLDGRGGGNLGPWATTVPYQLTQTHIPLDKSLNLPGTYFRPL